MGQSSRSKRAGTGGAIRAKPPVFVEKNAVSWSGPLGRWLGRAGNTAAKGLG